ncbi:MAG: dTDP-4-dehydrorhamnose 3,5-epimerase family protein [Actinomycetota bacterium]
MVAQSPVHRDERGSFREWFRGDQFQELLGRDFDVMQSNISISKKGVIRGIHYSMAKKSQAKWVTCVSGAIWDVVVDIRPSSPTFKQYVSVPLSSDTGDALFISEGLGHGFVALTDHTVVTYLLTSPYSPTEEFGINPLDQIWQSRGPKANGAFQSKIVMHQP